MDVKDGTENMNSALADKLSQSKHYYWFLIGFLVLLSALGSFVNDM